MIDAQRQVVVAAPADAVFAYLADFTTTTQWDPGTIRTERIAGDGGVESGVRKLQGGRAVQAAHEGADQRAVIVLHLPGVGAVHVFGGHFTRQCIDLLVQVHDQQVQAVAALAVAAGAEQMGASIREIAQNASEAADVAHRANRKNYRLLERCVREGRHVDVDVPGYVVQAVAMVVAFIACSLAAVVLAIWGLLRVIGVIG